MNKNEIDLYVNNTAYEIDSDVDEIENIDNKYFDFEDNEGTLFMVDINQFKPLSVANDYSNGTEICIMQTDIIELSRNNAKERWSDISITLFVDEGKFKVKYTEEDDTIDNCNIIKLPSSIKELSEMIIQLYQAQALFECDFE